MLQIIESFVAQMLSTYFEMRRRDLEFSILVSLILRLQIKKIIVDLIAKYFPRRSQTSSLCNCINVATQIRFIKRHGVIIQKGYKLVRIII